MEKDLVVIIDEEARKNLDSLKFRWFSAARERDDQTYLLENPLGEVEEVTGTLVRRHLLKEHAAEYLYLEITPTCQLRCKHCGIKGDLRNPKEGRIIDDEATYITDEFVVELSKAIENHPCPGLQRNLFFGGGEPLISPRKFAAINNAFSDFERTTRVVTTNGLNLPLDENAFTDFIESIGRPYIMFSCSDAHLAQYATLARGGRFPYHVPCQVAPENSLADKAATIEEYCRRLDVGFTDNVVESRESESKLAKDLRGYILKSAKKEPKIFSTEIDGFRHPCSQGQELSIRSNGRMYPHCYDIFNGTNYIGRIGLLQNR